MNCSTQRLTNLIIDYSILVFSSSSILITITIFLFIVYHLIKRKNCPHRVALLLTGNMYFALLLFFILIINTYKTTLNGHMYLDFPTNDNRMCRIRAYLVTVIICSLFYSNALQSIYRLCRVVFYMRKRFQSFQVYGIGIVVQWIICFLSILPALVFNHFEYLVADFHCQIPYRSLKIIVLYGTIIYVIPLIITVGCYFFTLRKSRSRQTMTQIQKLTVRRDVIVLCRICILLGLMFTFFIPATIILLINTSTGYLPWWSSQIRWLTYVLSMSCVTIVLAFISPHVRNLWTYYITNRNRCRQTRVTPAIIKIN